MAKKINKKAVKKKKKSSLDKGLKKTVETLKTEEKKVEMKTPKILPSIKSKENFEESKNIVSESFLALIKPTILRDRFLAVVAGVFFIWVIGWFSIVTIPHINYQTEDSKAFREEKENEKKLEEERELDRQENTFFEQGFADLTAKINTNEGELNFNLNYEAAPDTVENFARLGYRDYFDGLLFHRALKTDSTFIIQGGAPESRDSLDGVFTGETASGFPLADEIWEVEPIYEEKDGKSVITNDPKLKYSNFYSDFNKEVGTIKYRKGLIMMAKTNQPNSATSQFFITLADSKFPATYTVFGEIDSNSIEVLDKLAAEINPVANSSVLEGGQSQVSDGFLSKEVRIESLEVIRN